MQAGVNYANETHGLDVVLQVEFAGGGYNRPAGRAAVETLHAAGADILFFSAGGETDWGAIAMAEELEIPVIAASNVAFMAPETIVAQMRKLKDPVVTQVLWDLYYGRPVAGVGDHGLTDGTAGLTPTALTEDFFGAELLARVDELVERMMSGELYVPQNMF